MRVELLLSSNASFTSPKSPTVRTTPDGSVTSGIRATRSPVSARAAPLIVTSWAAPFSVPPGRSRFSRRRVCATRCRLRPYRRRFSSGISTSIWNAFDPCTVACETSGRAVSSSRISSARFRSRSSAATASYSDCPAGSSGPRIASRTAVSRKVSWRTVIPSACTAAGNVAMRSTAAWISSTTSLTSGSDGSISITTLPAPSWAMPVTSLMPSSELIASSTFWTIADSVSSGSAPG